MMSTVAILAAGLLAQATPPPKAAARWPAIVPLHATIDVSQYAPMAAFTIFGTNRKPTYLIECGTGAMNDAHSGDNPRDDYVYYYSGDWDCGLKRVGEKRPVPPTLLAEGGEGRDVGWPNRGRFYAEELAGRCADYPEYGSVRHFLLRGMRISMSVTHVRTETPMPERQTRAVARFLSFRFDLRVEPDPAATTPLAQPPEVEDPFVRGEVAVPPLWFRVTGTCDVVRPRRQK